MPLIPVLATGEKDRSPGFAGQVSQINQKTEVPVRDHSSENEMDSSWEMIAKFNP